MTALLLLSKHGLKEQNQKGSESLLPFQFRKLIKLVGHSEWSFHLTLLSASQRPHGGGVKEFFCSPIRRLFTLSPATCDN